METIYILGVELTAILILSKVFNKSIFIFLGFLLVIVSYFCVKKKNLICLLVPLIFLARVSFFKPEIRENMKNYYSIEEKGYLKSYFKNESEKLLKDSNYKLKAVYNAVILGENKELPKKYKKEFSYIGISHLMALSGFHIGLIIMVGNFILNKLPLSRIKKNMGVLIFLSLYYFGVEHSPSLNRAYIMGIIFILGNIFYENSDLMKSLLTSYIISIIIDPNIVNTISFRLSYLAVFIIIGVYPYIQTFYEGKRKIIKNIIFLLTIQIFMAPMLLYEFGQLQILSLISNLIAVPVGSLFVLLSFIGLLLQNVGLGFIILPLIKAIFWLFMIIVEILNKIPFMSISLPWLYHKRIELVFYFILIFVVFYLKNKREKNIDEKIFKRDKILQ